MQYCNGVNFVDSNVWLEQFIAINLISNLIQSRIYNFLF